MESRGCELFVARRTLFEIMRGNRPKLVKARETLRQRIDRIEREVTASWDLGDATEPPLPVLHSWPSPLGRTAWR